MYKLILKTILAFVFLFNMATNSFAQPFLKEVNYFKKLDSITTPPTNPILFIGSSSFTKWVDVKNYFPGYTILNRAFGGSSLPDVIYFAEEVIFIVARMMLQVMLLQKRYLSDLKHYIL